MVFERFLHYTLNLARIRLIVRLCITYADGLSITHTRKFVKRPDGKFVVLQLSRAPVFRPRVLLLLCVRIPRDPGMRSHRSMSIVVRPVEVYTYRVYRLGIVHTELDPYGIASAFSCLQVYHRCRLKSNMTRE